MNNKYKKILYVLLFFIIPMIAGILISSFPSLRLKYLSFGHDLNYHLQAIKGQSYTFQKHIFPIYINPLANKGAGDCRYIVYPYLFTYIPVIISTFISDYLISINIFIIIINILTFISTYKASMIIFKDKVASVFASTFYLLCFYRVFDIYDRQAMGEYIALAFTPLVIGGFYDIFFGDKKKWYYLVIGLTCIIQSHIITAFYYIILVIVASLICIPFVMKDKKVWRLYLLAGLITIALNMWYIIPFVQYYLEGEIDITSFGQYIKGFNDLYNNYIIDYREHSRFYNCLGFESLFAMEMVPILLVFIYIKKKVKDDIVKVDKSFLVAMIFLFIFYYYFIASMGILNIGILVNFYAKQQFLYRELGRGLPFLAMAFGYSVSNVAKNNVSKIIFIYVCLLISAYTTITYISTKITHERYDVSANATLPDYLFYSGSDGADKREKILSEEEFGRILGKKATVSEIQMDNGSDTILYDKKYNDISIKVSYDDIVIKDLQKGMLNYKLTYIYDGDNYKNEYIEFPLVAFTGYKAFDNDENVLPIKRGNNDYISINLYDKEGMIMVKFDPPILWKVGNIISLFTFLIIFILRIRYEVHLLKNENKK